MRIFPSFSFFIPFFSSSSSSSSTHNKKLGVLHTTYHDELTISYFLFSPKRNIHNNNNNNKKKRKRSGLNGPASRNELRDGRSRCCPYSSSEKHLNSSSSYFFFFFFYYIAYRIIIHRPSITASITITQANLFSLSFFLLHCVFVSFLTEIFFFRLFFFLKNKSVWQQKQMNKLDTH